LTEEEILHLSFRPLLPSSQGKLSEEFIELLQQLPVKPLTTVQSSGQDWFFLRFLMLTSRSVGKMVDVYKGDEDELIHNSSWAKIKEYIGRTSNAPSQPAPVPETEDTPPEAAALAPSDDNPGTPSNAPPTPQDVDTRPTHQPLDGSEETQAEAVSEEDQMVDDEQGGGQQPTPEDVAEPNESEEAEQQEETDNFPDFDVEKVQNDEETASLLLDCLKGELLGHDGEISPSEIIRILKGLGETRFSNAANEARKHSTHKKKLVDYLESHRVLRPYWFKPLIVLKRLAQAIDDGLGHGTTSAIALRKIIESFLASHPETIPPPQIQVEPAEGSDSNANTSQGESDTSGSRSPADRAPELSNRQKLLQILLQSGYMPSLEGRAREYTRRGLDLEAPILRKLMVDSEKGLTAPFQFVELSSAPLVHRTDIFSIPSAGGSIDALASVAISGEGGADDDEEERPRELIVIETKGRVTASSESRERRRQGIARLRQAHSRERHILQRKYWEVDAQSENFRYFVEDKKEAIQILHHAVVYDVKIVLLLMGNNDADIFCGIFVRFGNDIKTAWADVLRDIHCQSLQWAYDNQLESGRPSFEERTFLDPVLSRIKIQNKKDGQLDFRSFRQWVELWYDVRFRKALPLPPIARIVPYNIAVWNSFKGGSDTLTKLIWRADYNPPTNDIQAHAVARLLLLASTVVHRLQHMATANQNLNVYRSLRHYRNAANQRNSFYELMLSLSRVYGEPQSRVQILDPTSNNIFDRMSTRASSTVLESQLGARKTGKTPKRKKPERMESLMDRDAENMTESEKELVNRFQSCTGPCLYVVNANGAQGPKGPCGLCRKETSWFCFGCHQHFCFTTKLSDDGARASRTLSARNPRTHQIVKSVRHPDDDSGSRDKPLFIRNTCWLHSHNGSLQSTASSNNSLESSRKENSS
jgi:hypothetical protein